MYPKSGLFVALMFGLILSSCSKDSNPVMPPMNASVAGTWDMLLTDATGGTGNFIMIWTQSGGSISGTFSNLLTGAQGTMSGTVSGRSMSFTMVQTQPAACTGTFTGAGTVAAGDRGVTGTWSGSNCSGAQAGNLAGTKR